MSEAVGPSGGRSMFKFSPVTHDGRTRDFHNIPGDVDMIGVHTGDYAGMNVCNPRPGVTYQWAKRDATSRMLEAQKGGEPVLMGDEDHPAYELGVVYDESDTPTPLDTAQVYNDVVLYRYPEEAIASRQAKDAAASLRQVREADSAYLHGASPAELATGQGQRTRFAERRHRMELQDETGAVRESWNPEHGILDTNN